MSNAEGIAFSDNTNSGRAEAASVNFSSLFDRSFNSTLKQANSDNTKHTASSLPDVSIKFSESEGSDTRSSTAASASDVKRSNEQSQSENRPSDEVAPRRYEDPNPDMRGEFPLSTCFRPQQSVPDLADPALDSETREREGRIAKYCAPTVAAISRQERQRQTRP